ncbi:MAG: pyridoxamine 5'-phosphate oxidase [Dehalococcoidia bacterium]
MATWGEFAAAAPEIAERGARRLGIGVALIGTVARDGAPRVHPVTPLIAGGRPDGRASARLFVFVAVHTAKYPNLRRDSRYALHAVPGKDDEEFLLIGRAVESNDWASQMLAASAAREIGMTSVDHVLFELLIERAHWAVWEGLGTPDIRRVAERWP